jgi:hypothetical protein
MAEITKNSPVLNFLSLLGKWDYNVPLTTQWVVSITPDAGSGLFSIISDYIRIDAHDFYIPPSIQSRLLNEQVQPKFDGVGLYFAQSVNLPQESFSTASVGVDGMGGYLKGTAATDRLDMGGRNLKIDFLETNLDFVAGLIRPWIITASYKGLINLGTTNSIKSSIEIKEFTNNKAGEQKPLRKYHKFSGCVPVSVNERSLKYDAEEIKTNSVNWVFERYTYEIGS